MIKAIMKELILRKDELKAPLETIYFGGGTPSLLSYIDLSNIFEVIYSNYKLIDNPEISLEANPDDLSNTYLSEIKNLPINRLSIGVQSFFDEDLVYMNRSHNAKEAIQSIHYAQQVGFENITIDLIYGVPGLTASKWQENIQTFLDLQIPHLSSYALTVEPKTALDYFIRKKKYPPLDDVLASEHFKQLTGIMKENAFIHYELSNFAKESCFSKHNTSYWQGKPYLGIGPSAHSYSKNTRSWNVASNAKYIKAITVNTLPNTIENLSKSERYNEYIMTGLRTIWGVNMNRINTEFGEKYIHYFKEQIAVYLKRKSLKILTKNNQEIVVVNPTSFFLIDGIISDLFWVD